MSFFYNYYVSLRFAKVNFFGGIVLDNEFIKSAVYFSLINVFWLFIAKMDILMLSLISSPEEVGIYNVALRITAVGVLGISMIMKSSYPPLLRKIKKGPLKISELGFYPIIYLFMVIFGSLMLYFIFEKFILDIIGQEYIATLSILRIFVFFIILQSFVSPLIILLQALDLEKSIFICLIPLPVIKYILNSFLYANVGILAMAYSTIIIYVLFFLFSLTLNFRAIKSNITF